MGTLRTRLGDIRLKKTIRWEGDLSGRPEPEVIVTRGNVHLLPKTLQDSEKWDSLVCDCVVAAGGID